MATTLPFNYAHLWSQMEKGIDEQGPYYNVGYLFDNWSDSDAAANSLRGFTQRVGGITVRNTPHQHPLSPNLYCRSVQIRGIGRPILNSNGYPNYDSGFEVLATYRPVTWEGQYQLTDDPGNENSIDPSTPILWATQELDFDTEVFTVPNNTYKYIASGDPCAIPIKWSTGLTIMRITFHKLPYMPAAAIRSLRGKVNNATFLGAAAFKVLFKGGQVTRDISDDGSITQRCTLTFIERDQDWGSYPSRTSMVFHAVEDQAGQVPYTPADLSPLLAF